MGIIRSVLLDDLPLWGIQSRIHVWIDEELFFVNWDLGGPTGRARSDTDEGSRLIRGY